MHEQVQGQKREFKFTRQAIDTYWRFDSFMYFIVCELIVLCICNNKKGTVYSRGTETGVNE